MKFFAVVLLSLSTQVFAQVNLGPQAVELFKAVTHPDTEGCVRNFADLKLSDVAIAKNGNRFIFLGQKSAPGFNATKKVIGMEIAPVSTRTGSLGLQRYSCRLVSQ